MTHSLFQTTLCVNVLFLSESTYVSCVAEIVKHAKLTKYLLLHIDKGQERCRISKIVRSKTSTSTKFPPQSRLKFLATVILVSKRWLILFCSLNQFGTQALDQQVTLISHLNEDKRWLTSLGSSTSTIFQSSPRCT